MISDPAVPITNNTRQKPSRGNCEANTDTNIKNQHERPATKAIAMDPVLVFFFVLFIANAVVSIGLALFAAAVVNMDWGIAPDDDVREKTLG
ncbi:hypothetical protein PpBr36_07575 [Pyricularia pennisetigena]|uniref:hypothetical protein n=1 Tax=Pyricularia pennisetigena TaxID=1578925 RepID=UPI00114EDD0D|nr:hypothetical protein PpBr36_07575 [Pyricularia pennisetigena]TLS25000.1 hypothetical protein PpBr36_07575 [Pyricularia pennisetigena]